MEKKREQLPRDLNRLTDGTGLYFSSIKLLCCSTWAWLDIGLDKDIIVRHAAARGLAALR